MDCSYRIVTTSGSVMNISFDSFRMKGPSPLCPFDDLTVSFTKSLVLSVLENEIPARIEHVKFLRIFFENYRYMTVQTTVLQ